ncbi:MAG: hypothetical protein HC819_12770 [Cyclobacteriaceae bacterium]|nr:hypothetical protein [Cyclobacteriaceae bacterium]
MKRSKKIFLAFASAFLLAMMIIGYDISSRTTFPGSKKSIIERLSPTDSSATDIDTVKSKEKAQ